MVYRCHGFEQVRIAKRKSRASDSITGNGRPTKAQSRAKKIFTEQFEKHLLERADELLSRYFALALQNDRRGVEFS